MNHKTTLIEVWPAGSHLERRYVRMEGHRDGGDLREVVRAIEDSGAERVNAVMHVTTTERVQVVRSGEYRATRKAGETV